MIINNLYEIYYNWDSSNNIEQFYINDFRIKSIEFNSNMSQFYNGNYLSSLNLNIIHESFNNVINMYSCFTGYDYKSNRFPCLVKGAPICGNNVINFSKAYYYCSSLTGQPVCGNNVTNMASTYTYCSSLTGNPTCGNNVTDMYFTYFGCSSLMGNPVCGPNVTNMAYTYEFGYNLTGNPVCENNVINFIQAYYWCNNLTGSPVCGENVTNMYFTYRYCWNLTGNPVCGDNVVNMDYAYDGCYNLTGAPVCGNNVKSMGHAFRDCHNLQGNMFMKSDYVTGTYGALADRDTYKRINVYVRANTQTNTSISQNSIGACGWTLDKTNNCYYNTATNIYVYYNWNGVVW